MAARVFGHIPSVSVGATYQSREAVAAAGVHRPTMAGISGAERDGADSIVVSGGYEDDEDYGNVIVYTGAGGNDPSSGTQIADQTLTRRNLALAVSADRGLPVRVVRGAGGDPDHSPQSGFRYDGLFKSGYKIWRYRLVEEPPANPVTNPPPEPGPDEQRAYASVQRLVRNTAVTQWVKALYDFRCQVCGLRMETAAGPYAEGGHLRPVGRPHNGPDTADNVLCLCPNDHVRLDRGTIVLDSNWAVVERASGRALGELTVHRHHGLNVAHASYHRGLFP
jgi:putative restriction endonuclease